jgi:hypothetical protein
MHASDIPSEIRDIKISKHLNIWCGMVFVINKIKRI